MSRAYDIDADTNAAIADNQLDAAHDKIIGLELELADRGRRLNALTARVELLEGLLSAWACSCPSPCYLHDEEHRGRVDTEARGLLHSILKRRSYEALFGERRDTDAD